MSSICKKYVCTGPKKNLHDGTWCYELEIFQQFRQKLSHAVLTRKQCIENPNLIPLLFGEELLPVAFNTQLHGTKVATIDGDRDGRVLEGDALITARPQTPLLIRIADCASILLYEPARNVAANIHAGWRGIAKGVIRACIEKLTRAHGVNAEDMYAGVSPMIGPCCCTFSHPHQELPPSMHRYIKKENRVDLWSAVEDQLGERGVPTDHIERPRVCTSCNSEDFYSYRRDGKEAGRFGTLIMLQ